MLKLFKILHLSIKLSIVYTAFNIRTNYSVNVEKHSYKTDYEHGNEQTLKATGKQRDSLRSIMNNSVLEQRSSPWLSTLKKKKKRQSNNSKVTILNTPWMIYRPDLQGKMVGWMRWLRLGQQIRSHRGLQTINGPSLGLARLMEQNFVTFLWVGTGGGGELKWVETNGHFMKHKTLALQRNTMTKFIKKIWWYITIFSLFMCCNNISLSTKPLSYLLFCFSTMNFIL